MRDGILKVIDMEMTGEQLSMAIQALDELDMLKVTDFNGGRGIGTCSFMTDFVDIERDDRGNFMQMIVSKVSQIPGRGIEDETFLDYPEELKIIPDFDYEKFCFHLFEDDDQWHFDVEVDYRLTEALYEFNEVSGPYFENSVPENITVTKVVLKTGEDDFDVTDFIDEETKKLLLDYCRDYMEENAEFIKD